MNEYTFNFSPENHDSEIIAKVISGKDKGKNIYLNESSKSDIESDKVELLYEYLMKTKVRLTQRSLDKLAESVLHNEEPEDEKLAKIYKEFIKYQKTTNEIMLRDSELEFVPYQGNEDNVQRQGIFLAAAAGSGKTYWIANYCRMFNKLYPRSPIYLFSAKPITDEKEFKTVKRIKQVELTDESLDEIIENGSYTEFISKSGQSLCVFDDYDALSKSVMAKLETVLNSIIQVGRSKRIFYIVSKHTLNEGKKTKLLWSESSDIILFPNGLSRYSLVYSMKVYLGFDQVMIDKVLNHKSRFVAIHTRVPRYFITQNSIGFL